MPMLMVNSSIMMLAKADERIIREKAYTKKMAVKGRIPKRKAQRERIQIGMVHVRESHVRGSWSRRLESRVWRVWR